MALTLLLEPAGAGAAGEPDAAADAAGTRTAAADAAGTRTAAADAAAWGRVLARFGKAGGVDYAGLKRDRRDLDAYLASLAAARPGGWSKAEQIAFWSNAYNAVTVHHVLARYPGIRSVKAEDGFFDELTYPVAGKRRTLDEIETEARKLGDARVHFAVVCASTSCPDLRPEPYRAAALDRQLAEQTRAFLADRGKGLRYDAESNTLHLSSIFKWYAGDFTGGSTVVAFFARGGIVDWVLPYLPKDLAETVRRREPAVKYLDYDWGLNDRKG